MQAAVLQLERVTVALVDVGEAGELRRQQGAVVVGQDLGRGALLRVSAEGIRGRCIGR